MTATTEEPEKTVEVNGTECIVVPKEDFEDIQSRLEALEGGKKEEEAQPPDVIEIRSEGERVDLNDIWIAGIPLGKLLHRVRKEVDDIRKDLETGGSPSSEPEPGVEDDETPLERVASLPQAMLDDESPNDRRAVLIARGIKDYVDAKKVMGEEYMVTSGEIRKALERLDEDSHTQTVSRVMENLDDLGKDQVTVKKKRGTRRVYFESDLVKRLKRISQCGDGGHEYPPAESRFQAG